MKSLVKILGPMRKKLNRARALRDAFLTEVTDEELESVFKVWSRPEVTQIINESGEIDNPIPLGLRLLKEVPEFRSLATKAILRCNLELVCIGQAKGKISPLRS